jgi:hypothetical protein
MSKGDTDVEPGLVFLPRACGKLPTRAQAGQTIAHIGMLLAQFVGSMKAEKI